MPIYEKYAGINDDEIHSDGYHRLNAGETIIIDGMEIKSPKTVKVTDTKKFLNKSGSNLTLIIDGEITNIWVTAKRSTIKIKNRKFELRMNLLHENMIQDRMMVTNFIELKPVETFESMFPSLKTRLMQWLSRFKIGALLDSKKT